MKKFAMTMITLSLSAMLLAGCGDSAKETEQESLTGGESSEVAETETVEEKIYPEESYLDNLKADDYVELGEYMGLEVTLEAPYVSDEQIENYIQRVLDNNPVRTEVTGRAVKEGDVTDISYVGKKDGVAFDGGTADNYMLTIGAGQFIDGFEDGVVGMKAGETKDLELTFPDPYERNPDLAGAPVVFTVTLNKIYEESEAQLSDDFVAGLSIENVATVGEYRQYIYDGMMEEAQRQYDMDEESAILAAAHENAAFHDVPEAMVERYYDRLVSNMTYQAAMYGMDLDTFMLYGYGKQAEQYEEEMKDSARQAAEQILMMQAIAEREGLTVSNEEMEESLSQNAEQYGYESVDAYKEVLGNEVKGYREYVMSGKVTAFLVEKAKITQSEPVGETETGQASTEEAEDTQASTEEVGDTKESAEEPKGDNQAGAGTKTDRESAETESETETESAGKKK